MRLKGEAYSKRLREYSDDTIRLISRGHALPKAEYAKARDITTNSELSEEQVAECLRELLCEYEVSLECARSIAKLMVSLKNSALRQSTKDKTHRVLINIGDMLGRGKKMAAADKLIPLIESGISDEDLLKVLEEIEQEVK